MHSSKQRFTAAAGTQSATGNATQSKNRNPQGLLDRAAVLLDEPNQLHTEILDGYRAELRPSSFMEDHFVYELAAADWRMKLFDRIALGVLACHANSAYNKVMSMEIAATETSDSARSAATEPGPVPLCDASPDIRTIAMGAAWLSNSPDFALLARCRAQAKRDHERALKHLQDLRTGKAGYLPAEQPEKNETKPNEAAQPKSTAEKNQTKPPMTSWPSQPNEHSCSENVGQGTSTATGRQSTESAANPARPVSQS